MNKESLFRTVGSKIREFTTGKLLPEERQAIIDELYEDETSSRLAIALSDLLHPNGGNRIQNYPFTYGDLTVAMDRGPFERASDRSLRHMIDLTRNHKKIFWGDERHGKKN